MVPKEDPDEPVSLEGVAHRASGSLAYNDPGRLETPNAAAANGAVPRHAEKKNPFQKAFYHNDLRKTSTRI
jgi:hypothetical protein